MKKQDQIIGLIANINEKSGQFINEELKKINIRDIIHSHGSIFSLLYQYEGILSINSIVQLTGKRKSSITDMVKKLETLGYVSKRKSPSDARIIELHLTQKGWDFQESFQKISRELLAKTYHGFTEEEQETLISLLWRLKKNFEK